MKWWITDGTDEFSDNEDIQWLLIETKLEDFIYSVILTLKD